MNVVPTNLILMLRHRYLLGLDDCRLALAGLAAFFTLLKPTRSQSLGPRALVLGLADM